MSILTEIVAAKRKEVERFKPLSSIARFEKEGFFWQFTNRSLKNSLLAAENRGIIAEFKRRSPSKGWFKSKEVEVESVVKEYNRQAAGVSILTDEQYFGGDLDDLIQAKIITDVPVLRKDFIVDAWQIAESKAFGADVILLIAACLQKEQVKEFSSYAKSIGLEVLLEIHDERELDHICENVDIVGINNRNLNTFEVDIETSLKLINKIPPGFISISESGIDSVETIVTLRKAGFKGFLIGEKFMKAENPTIAFAEFINHLKASNNG